MSGLEQTLRRLAPPARLVDWSILGIILFGVISGLVSFTVGRPSGWYVVWSHRVAGTMLIGLLAFKFARVRRRVTNTAAWQPSTALSVLLGVVALTTLATGIAWGWIGLEWVVYWTVLSLHVGLGLVLIPLTIAHMTTRFRLPRRRDFQERRTALKYAGLLAAGGLVARGQNALARASDTVGSVRRFTGSKPVDTGGAEPSDSESASAAGTGSFPVTAWVADNPEPIDRDAWSVTVTGLVEEPLSLGYDEVQPEAPAGAITGDAERALLDCTSGWYTVQQWEGVRVGDLLEAAGTAEDAAYVRFVSVTGYRWSLPLAEAREALLATDVAGEPLTHGHGAPARLVAPGRRGFQWVKWVDRIEVRARGDPEQWVVTLVSGFD